MKLNFGILGIAVAASIFANAALAETPHFNQRQQNQEDRITQGVKSGELTRREAGNLVQGQAELQRMENRAKHDGTVTKKERARLHSKANMESNKIRRNKNNDRQR